MKSNAKNNVTLKILRMYMLPHDKKINQKNRRKSKPQKIKSRNR